MPVFERLDDAILVSDRNEDGNLVRRSSSEDVINVAIPFFGCSVCLTQKEALTQNIFIGTVIRLYELKSKEGMDQGQIRKYIAEHTALDPVVIKTIIKKYSNNIDVDTHALNTQKQIEDAFIFYNPVNNTFYQELLDNQMLDRLSQIDPCSLRVFPERSEMMFSLCLQKRPERALLLQLSEERNAEQYTSLQVPTSIPPTIITKITNRIKQNHDYAESLFIEDTKARFPVWFLCQLYVDFDDLTDIQVVSPLPGLYSNSLIDFIRETAKKNPKANGDLLNRLNQLEQTRKDALESASTFDAIKQATIQNLLIQYTGLAKYKSLSQKVATFISRFPADESGDAASISSHWTTTNRKDTSVSFHSAMEALFAQACETLYPFDDDNAISTLSLMVDKFKSYRSISEKFYSAIAIRVGFSDEEGINSFFADNKSKIKRKDISDILRKSRERILTAKENNKSTRSTYEYHLTELIIAMMLEADAAKDHPFTEIAAKCPNLFEAMARSNERRILEKHHDERAKNQIPSIEELYRMKSLLETCLSLLSEKKEAITTSADASLGTSGREIAQIRANDDLKEYPNMVKVSGIRTELQAVCFRFHYHDTEYFSSCYNLIDSILYEMLIRYDSDEDWDIIQSFFSGNSKEDWTKVTSLFEKYECQYDSSIVPPTTSNMLGENRELKPVSPRNKVAMMFAVFDQKQTELLSRICHEIPDFPFVVDRVNAERGHSNESDFSDMERMKSFHKHFLDTCEVLSKYILEED